MEALALFKLAMVGLMAAGGGLAMAQTPPPFACNFLKNPETRSFAFCNRSLEVGERVQDLVSRLSLDEKVGFLASKNPAVARLGIPSYEWWSEALHGVSYVGPGTHFSAIVPGATSFPQVIHSAASFNASLFFAMGKVVSTEARAMYNMGLAGLTFWSPNVNIFRDPRWGRGQETPGEDPLLVSKYAVNYVRGLQESDDPNTLKVAACCKHYTAYDVDNWRGIQRYTFNAVVTKQDLDDTFQPPFKSCVVDGNVASVMCSYNQVNGVPTCADPDLLAGTIRGAWKLNGYIVSDCDSVDVLYNAQHYTKSPEEAAAKSILAGLDLNCGSFLGQHTKSAVLGGFLNESDVDRAISHNLETLMRLGFYDGDPANGLYSGLGPKDVCSAEHQQLALEAARQGVVLLKNANSSLPFYSSSLKTLAVIGPNANVTKTMLGNYEGSPCKYVTPLQGMGGYVATLYEPGCMGVACTGGNLQLSPAKQAAAAADATVLVMGTDQSIEREGLDRVSLTLPGQQEALITEVAKVSKGPVVLVIMSGGPFDITFAKNNENISAIIWVGFPGEKGGAAIADVIFGAYNPSGRLPVTWYPQSFAERVPMTDMNMRANPAAGYPGRSYRFYGGDVVYGFGDGLSYSEFQHHLVAAPKTVAVALEEGHECLSRRCKSVELAGDGCRGLVFEVMVRVRNGGGRAGGHTVMLFSTPPAARGAPMRQLVAFEKVFLGKGEEKKVGFSVDVCRDLSTVDEMGVRKLALGEHLLHVGGLKHSLSLRV